MAKTTVRKTGDPLTEDKKTIFTVNQLVCKGLGGF